MADTITLPFPKAVLFDLDGTLVDSAPDLAAAINHVRKERGLAALPYEILRPVASAGAPGLIRAAFGLERNHPDYDALSAAFLQYYAENIYVESSLFEGMPELLDFLRAHEIAWGVVTNKRHQLTVPLLKEIGLTDAACVISGDTTAHAKPHPEPVLEAARRMQLQPSECWFVGDDLRDVQSGNAAGSITVAVNWGYGSQTASWNARLVVDTPQILAEVIQQKTA